MQRALVTKYGPKRLARALLRRLARPITGAARQWAGAIRCVDTAEPAVALTFDDGPSPSVTPQVLRILRRYDARATFFMIGENAERNLPLVRRVADEGHVIGNHSWSHLSLPLLSARECCAQVGAGQAALFPYASALFRPPYGHQSWQSRLQCLRLGYEVVAFSVHAEDWLARSPEWIARRLIERTRPGSIIILHDNIYRNVLPYGHLDRRSMLEGLKLALGELSKTYRFVTVPDLLCCGSAVRDNWYERGAPELEQALRCQINEIRQAEEQGLIVP
jgi:peptidoglycan/xylan/chitin deacetylase (PgdA/CDA1 family)